MMQIGRPLNHLGSLNIRHVTCTEGLNQKVPIWDFLIFSYPCRVVGSDGKETQSDDMWKNLKNSYLKNGQKLFVTANAIFEDTPKISESR